jgi:restriction endonuclease Mrr
MHCGMGEGNESVMHDRINWRTVSMRDAIFRDELARRVNSLQHLLTGRQSISFFHVEASSVIDRGDFSSCVQIFNWVKSWDHKSC